MDDLHASLNWLASCQVIIVKALALADAIETAEKIGI